MTKHTPGPWHWASLYDQNPTRKLAGMFICSREGIVVVKGAPTAPESLVEPALEMRANAALIAAAPELLKALRDVAVVLDAVWREDMNRTGDFAMLPPPELDRALVLLRSLESE